MAKTLLVLDEALAILQVVGASTAVRDKFREQAAFALSHKARRDVPDDGTDAITVSAGYGQQSQRGFVELTINETLTQMDTAKAREVGLMLIQSSEAAISDEIVMTLFREKLGLDSVGRSNILLALREIRQGTRGIAWPAS